MSIEQKNVLVVDDSADIRVLLTELLEDAGATVTTCEDGAQALSRLGRNNYDLVVTDILMPEGDGVSVIRSLKQGHNPTPVLAISGGNATLAPYWLLKITQSLDVDAVLHKPFEPDEFLEVVSGLV